MRNNHTIKIVALLGLVMVFCTLSADAATPAPAKEPLHPAGNSEDSAHWRRDPFAGAETKNAPIPAGRVPAGLKSAATDTGQPELTIQGIMQTGRKGFHALINGRVVKTGDKLDGLTISKISRYRVVFQDNHKEKSIYDIYQGRIDRGKQ